MSGAPGGVVLTLGRRRLAKLSSNVGSSPAFLALSQVSVTNASRIRLTVFSVSESCVECPARAPWPARARLGEDVGNVAVLEDHADVGDGKLAELSCWSPMAPLDRPCAAVGSVMFGFEGGFGDPPRGKAAGLEGFGVGRSRV